MADFAPNYTSRVKYTYQGLTGKHSAVIRGVNGVSRETLLGSLVPFETALAGVLSNDASIISRETAAPGDGTFFPTSWGTVAATGPNQAYTQALKAYAISIPGRTLAAGKGRIYLFNVFVGEQNDANWVYTGAEVPARFKALIDAVNGNPNIAGSDGTKLVLYDRVTIKVNDRVVRKIRNL